VLDDGNTAQVPPANGVKNNLGWTRRLRLASAWTLAFLVIAGGVLLVRRLNYKPRLTFPPDVAAALLQKHEYIPSFSRTDAETLKRIYGLDNCVEGAKYGALCQDGNVLFEFSPVGLEICSEHGGVNTWIECR